MLVSLAASFYVPLVLLRAYQLAALRASWHKGFEQHVCRYAFLRCFRSTCLI